MKKINAFLVFLITSVLVISCNSRDDIDYGINENGEGSLAMSLNAQVATFKSSSKATVDPSTFVVDIIDANGGLYRKFDAYSKVPASFQMKVGTFTLKSYSGVQLEAGFDAPYYEGSQIFTIEKDKTTPVNLTCTLANMVVTVDFTDAFKAAVKDYTVTVTNGAGNLIYDVAGKMGYFKVAPLTIVLNGKAVLDDSPVTFTHTINSVAAKDFHKIKFDFTTDAGILSKPGIVVDQTTNDVNTTITVPGNGTSGGGTPTVEAAITGLNGLNLDQPLVYSLAAVQSNPIKVQVKLEAASGIKNLNVTVTSAVVENFLPKTFDLANLEPSLKADLIALNVISATDEIKGAKSFIFDISNFMGLLNESTHTFAIELVAGNGTAAAKSLVIKPTK